MLILRVCSATGVPQSFVLDSSASQTSGHRDAPGHVTADTRPEGERQSGLVHGQHQADLPQLCGESGAGRELPSAQQRCGEVQQVLEGRMQYGDRMQRYMYMYMYMCM